MPGSAGVAVRPSHTGTAHSVASGNGLTLGS